MTILTRHTGLLRAFLLLLPVVLAGCNTTAPPQAVAAAAPAVDPLTARRYAAIHDEKHQVPGVDPSALKPRNVRQLVDYPTKEKPGTVVIDTNARFIYLVQEGGKALRYGVGVGKEGLEFKGSANVQRKAQWPRWTPTPDMIRREPGRYKRWTGGMEGGTANPLGARALYLFKDGKDTLYRIHGTNEPDTIGEAVSSGCIRMMNQDVIDLYGRVPLGSKVIVL
ncbi:L,D-transpeptidase [Microvirga sp. 17 mud 1-3]|nr:L,D-transpeptidase [Microvirga sp. 17 mud 1-3]